jgi:aminomethyltransferase
MNDASRLAIGQAQYSALLYPQGTFVDDVIVHRLGEDEYLLVINAGTREKDFNWVRDNTRQFDCKVEHLSDDFTQIAIQGPKGVDLLQKLTDADLSAVKFYWVTRGTVCGLKNILMGRTGYTAEDGFEIYIPADEATSARVWYEILEAGKEFGVVPCGLGARNTLRLEGCLSLYGHEISDTINVWEAGLDRFCKMEKPTSSARRAREGEGRGREENAGRPRDGRPRHRPRRLQGSRRRRARDRLRHQRFSGAVPEEEYCAGLCSAGAGCDWETVKVEIRGQGVKAQVVPTPFYKRPKKA